MSPQTPIPSYYVIKYIDFHTGRPVPQFRAGDIVYMTVIEGIHKTIWVG